MIVCEKCFKSEVLLQKVKRVGVRRDCPTCGSEKVLAIEAKELRSSFERFIDHFRLDTKGSDLGELIHQTFPGQIFSSLTRGGESRILAETFEGDSVLMRFVNEPVSLGVFTDMSLTSLLVFLQPEVWDDFAGELIETNRFHIQNSFDLQALDSALRCLVKVYPEGTTVYRVRRAKDQNGFPQDRMSNPPREFATPGRANPEGISYLYVALDSMTAVLESRAQQHDYVSIGHFQVSQDVRVCSLHAINAMDPIQHALDDELNTVLAQLPFLQKLESELSKPLRSSDSHLSYLPTQYISEFIKSIGFDAIEYRSTLNQDGINWAMFDPSLANCVTVETNEVVNLTVELG